MARLLVVGAINTDLIAFVKRAPLAGETVAGGHFEQHGGGKGANQAVAAVRSQTEVSLLSAVGDDDFGRTRLSELGLEGIDISGCNTLPDVASGVAIIIVESSGENRICDLPGARENLTSEQCLQAYERRQPAAVLSTNELPFDCLESVFKRAADDGVAVWFNAAPFSIEARELIPYIDTLIVNRGEAEDLLNAREQERSVEDLASGLRELGVQKVIITLGSDGVRGFDGDDDVLVPAEHVQAVDTTGAGDTFCGAWASERLMGASFTNALHYASQASAISVTRRGAQSSIPQRSEVKSR